MRKKKTIIILVLLLTVGFASVSATLVLNGTIGIATKKSDFNVIFTSAKLDGTVRNDFIDIDNKQTITFETNKLTDLNETTTLEYEVTNTSRLYDANMTISCTPTDNEYITMGYNPTSMTVKAGKTESGRITATLKKTSIEDKSISVTCTLNVSESEREELGSEYIPKRLYSIVNDTNNNGEADIGEEISIGAEHFYVISNNGTEINALAKYNLKVGNIYASDGSTLERTISLSEEKYGIQNAQMRGYVPREKRYGTVAFTNNNGWDNTNNKTINIKSYDGPVKEALYGENGYEKHIQKTIPTGSVRLITKSELENLGCSSTNNTCTGASNWVYSTSYWTQSASSDSERRVWSVGSDGYFSDYSFDNNFSYGVRPVITIPLS